MQELFGSAPPLAVGRYVMFGEIASGGMATVHFGLLNGPVGFRRTVAIKRLHENYAKDPSFVTQFLDEARLAARIRHPNVIQTLDVVTEDKELLLVMEYVEGETLARLSDIRRTQREWFPLQMAVGVVAGALHGLHAAHEATDEHGVPLAIVHRDVSPQNIIVGRDGVPRVLDFGVAKAAARIQTTQGELVKGKLKYMAPEQVSARPLDRRTDVFAAGIVLWETLTHRPLFESNSGPASIIQQVVSAEIPPPRQLRSDISPELEAVVMKALSRNVEDRYQSASEFADALESVVAIPSAKHIGRWVCQVAGEALEEQARMRAAIERRAAEPNLTDTGVRLIETARTADSVPAERADAPTVADVVPITPPPTPVRLAGGGSGAEDWSAAGRLLADSSWPRRRTAFTMVGLLGLGMLVGWWIWGRETAPHLDPPVQAAGPLPSSYAQTTEEHDEAGKAPETKEQDVPDSVASAEPTPMPPVTSRRRSRARTKCANPMYVDREGIKRYRPECL